ncbi:unnamed protein product [Symbiodinium natans]|uniref:Uncharacterized protein n=1 Tax=Symbiodinium natans TaxID=878477 RepID=A0A812Q958_9DINO|nr:unnamed protein product [Symbiodinium natans]
MSVEQTFSDTSSQEGFECKRPGYVQQLLDQAICSIQAATNPASRRRKRQKLQRRLSEFLDQEQYEEAMEQFKVLCETRLGYVWRVAEHSDMPCPRQPAVCYLQFNETSVQWEHSFRCFI